MLLDEFLSSSARRFPSKTACVFQEQRISYEEFDRQVNQFANAILQAGFQRWDRFVIFLDNSIQSLLSIFGVLRAGGIFVVVNPSTKRDKLQYILNDSGATGIIIDSRFASILESIATGENPLLFLITTGGVSLGSNLYKKPIREFQSICDRADSNPPDRKTIDMDLAAIIYTSGSTGFPKGVMMTHFNMISAANSITEYLENTSDDIILNALPLSFDYGLYQALMAAKTGATLILEKSFTYPFDIIRRIREEKVTGFPGVPTIFALLLQMKDISPTYFDTVRYVTNTAAALPPAYIHRMRSLFRNAKIYSMYGLTECKRVSFLSPDQLDTRITSVGRGMPNEEVYIVDDNGNPVPPGGVGELVVRGSNVMQGYWGKPEETFRVLRPGRFPWEKVLFTGDLFRMDKEGYLYFVARKDDILKCKGEKVSPLEVEQVLHDIPGVQEAAVIGIPDPILGEAIKAVIVKSAYSPLSEQEVKRFCSQKLESFMVPTLVEFVESLPKSSNGKIKKEELKMQHLSRHPQNITTTQVVS